ncbi:dimethylarginine dimethylaminohydrolase family protein [Terrilactibacillus laevilacticus]|uniref:dimethylarginine dimethylaminohydrolase family protein n=1 Tax=Terrilactibacillus laevilacticus TaxID=1380157 RepID=UPI0011473FA1|nr:arginine deiminase family protein [Terrilactibacillus laevilacticus]
MSRLHEFLGENFVKEPASDKGLLEKFWDNNWGVTNSVGKIRKILVHRPDKEVHALQNAKFDPKAEALILRDDDGEIVSYCLHETAPDLALMQAQHDKMVSILKAEGIEVIELEDDGKLITNKLFARDVGMVVPGGLILTRFAFKFRYGETRLALRTAARIGMPVLASIQGNGYAEGGSFAVLDAKTAIVGRSIRVNQEGIDQLRDILSWQGMELIVVDLPAHLIHLDETFMMVDRDKALVDITNLPHWFLELLQDRGIKLIITDPNDPPLTNNCLCLSPGKVLFSEKGQSTMKKLQENNIEVIPININEINAMGGGLHCSTLVLDRDDI